MPWDKDSITRLIEVEAQLQNVDPRLAVSLAEQESGLNLTIRSPKGAYGIFQLMPGTAKQLKVNIDDPADNIRGGVTYLKQQLDAFGGDPAKAIAAYNAGPGVVQAYKGVPPYKETRGLVSRVLGSLGPGSAEASTSQAAAPRSRLDEIEAELARRDAPPPPQAKAPSPPTATSTPVQDAAYRDWAAQQPVEDIMSQTQTKVRPQPATPSAPSQAPPAPSPDPTATPGMRFQALPSITQLEPADRLQKTRDFERLKPAMQEEFLRSEEPTAGGLAVGGGPVAQSQPVTDPAALLAMGKRAPGTPWREGDPLPPGAKRPPTPTEAPVTEGITAPSTMIPLLMPGAGVKVVAPLLSKAGPLITRGARAAAEGLSQTAGWTAGRTAETGEVPSPGEIGTEAAINVATGGVVEIPSALRGAKNAALRSTPGAQILLNQRAIQEAEGLGKRVFNAQDKDVVGRAFDSVAATKAQLDITPVRDLWKSLTPAEQRIAGAELNKISSTFAGSLKTPTSSWDIGELQHLYSELRKAGLTKRTPETQDLLQALRGSVSESIHNGMARGSLPAAELLQAQSAYRKVMQAEDLQGLVTKHTRDSPNLKWQELNLAALNKELRGGGTKAARNLMKGMDATEKQLLMQELDSLKRHYPFVSIPRQGATMAGTSAALAATGLALTGNLPAAAAVAIPAILAAASRSPNVMSIFKKSIIEGKGRLAQHHVDALMTAIRHENEQPPGTVRVTPTGTGQ